MVAASYDNTKWFEYGTEVIVVKRRIIVLVIIGVILAVIGW